MVLELELSDLSVCHAHHRLVDLLCRRLTHHVALVSEALLHLFVLPSLTICYLPFLPLLVHSNALVDVLLEFPLHLDWKFA